MSDLNMLLGRLWERSEHTARTVDRIESRQIGIEARIVALEKTADDLSRLERWTKRGLALSAPVGTLWATGSTEKAIEVYKLLSGGH